MGKTFTEAQMNVAEGISFNGARCGQVLPKSIKHDAWKTFDQRDQTVIFCLRTSHIDIGADLNKIECAVLE